MAKAFEISGKLLTRNWLLNLIGQVLPVLVGLLVMPYVVRSLGAERFGVLSVAWVLLSYTATLDFGLSQATTKFSAEHLARSEHDKFAGVVWISAWAQVTLGIVFAGVAVVATPYLVDHFFVVSAGVQVETKHALMIMALSLPAVLVGNVFRGVLEAGQRFELVNYVRAPANTCIFLLPAGALLLGAGLPVIVILLVCARSCATLTYVLFCLRSFPVLRVHPVIHPAQARPLLVYGGWVTVSNMISPLMTYLDRVFIGSMVSITAVGYYTAPYEVIRRVSILPGSLTATIFPAFSSLDAAGAHKRREELCVRSLKSVLLVLAPFLILAVVFARYLLNLWLGPEFALNSTGVFQILAVGILINTLAFIPFVMLQALGRPDLNAKFHLIELPLYLFSLFYLLKHMGLTGAAVAWTMRVLLDALLLFGAVLRLRLVSTTSMFREGLVKTAAAIAILGALLSFPRQPAESRWGYAAFIVTVVVVFGFVSWNYLLDKRDRTLVVTASEQLRATLVRMN